MGRIRIGPGPWAGTNLKPTSLGPSQNLTLLATTTKQQRRDGGLLHRCRSATHCRPAPQSRLPQPLQAFLPPLSALRIVSSSRAWQRPTHGIPATPPPSKGHSPIPLINTFFLSDLFRCLCSPFRLLEKKILENFDDLSLFCSYLLLESCLSVDASSITELWISIFYFFWLGRM